jgi:hypothetical protein
VSKLALLLMAGLLAGCAQSQTAGSATSRADYDAAFQAVLARPNDVETVIKYSEVAASVGDYESSIAPLEGLFLYDSNLPKVRLQLGILYAHLRSFHTAHSYFMTALACPDITPDTRQLAEQAIARIPARYRS